MMDIATLNEYLGHRVMEVIFEKADGTDRFMRCTKSLVLIPKELHPKGLTENSRTPTPGLIKAFDLDLNAWRSFHYDSVKEISLGTPRRV